LKTVTEPQIDSKLRDKLLCGLESMALSLPEHAVEQLLRYLALLVKWNGAYNLTAVRDAEQMVSRHLLDSLAVWPFLQGQQFADVGTGAGLPGLVLAIAEPQKQFVLVDSNGKKIRFVTQAIGELQLPNATALQTRVEQWQPITSCDAVLSRAFASLSEMATLCEHLLTPTGRLLAMKGNYPADEIAALPSHWQVEASQTLKVPDETGQRHLIILSRRHH
jgi:16S rRNA (guanine527-N7)-methyltransferase